MDRRLRPLAAALPDKMDESQGALPLGTSAPLPKRHRVGVPAACEQCRRRKSRCDGQRPSCERCYSEGVTCSYVTAEGETHHTALKRKYQVAMEENRQLRELFGLIHERPAIEANEIYTRIRRCDDPFEVLELVRQADLLLPRPQHATNPSSGLLELKEGPQGDSFIQLPARPWSVAATDRIVPEMMTNLFLKRSILSRALEERLAKLRLENLDSMSIDPAED